MELKGLRIAIQGFGNVGSVAARLLFEEGCKVIAISGSKGGAYNAGGIDVKNLIRHVKEKKQTCGLQHGCWVLIVFLRHKKPEDCIHDKLTPLGLLFIFVKTYEVMYKKGEYSNGYRKMGPVAGTHIITKKC